MPFQYCLPHCYLRAHPLDDTEEVALANVNQLRSLTFTTKRPAPAPSWHALLSTPRGVRTRQTPKMIYRTSAQEDASQTLTRVLQLVKNNSTYLRRTDDLICGVIGKSALLTSYRPLSDSTMSLCRTVSTRSSKAPLVSLSATLTSRHACRSLPILYEDATGSLSS